MILQVRLGYDHIGHKPYRPQQYGPQQDDIGHNRKPYQPHKKSISATDHIDIGYKIIMMSLLRIIISLLHVYVIVSYSVSCSSLPALSVVIRLDLFVSLFHFRVCQYETVVVNSKFSCHYRRLDS